jgi:hypothetical protein
VQKIRADRSKLRSLLILARPEAWLASLGIFTALGLPPLPSASTYTQHGRDTTSRVFQPYVLPGGQRRTKPRDRSGQSTYMRYQTKSLDEMMCPALFPSQPWAAAHAHIPQHRPPAGIGLLMAKHGGSMEGQCGTLFSLLTGRMEGQKPQSILFSNFWYFAPIKIP